MSTSDDSSLKRVVIIGADFSPSSLPPATRIRFFARYLRDFGWEPIIITTKPEYYEWAIDPENEKLLPHDLKIVRTEAFRASWTRKLGIGDIGIRSLWHHWRALKDLCRQQKVDLILIPVPPNIAMVLGRLAHRRFGVPYLIDYIDPWVTESYWTLPKPQRPPKWALAYALARVLEPFALKHAAGIVGVSKGTTESVTHRYSWIDSGIEIPYGVETADMNHVRRHPRKNEIFGNDNRLHISCVGAYTETMRGSLVALFEGFRRGLNEMPNEFGRVQMHFIGTSYSGNGQAPYRVTAVAREAGVEEFVDEQPARVSYLDSLQLMLDSEALILLGSSEAHYTASKIFPYILADKPLITIFHEDSSVVSIMNELGISNVLTFGPGREPSLCADEVRKRIEEILRPAPERSATNWEALEKYSAKAMTWRLVEAMDLAIRKPN